MKKDFVWGNNNYISGRSSVASRRAIRQGGRSPTELSQRSRLVEEQDEQVDEAEPLKYNDNQIIVLSGRSSVGRVSAFQADCREFESRRPLHKNPIDICSSGFYCRMIVN